MKTSLIRPANVSDALAIAVAALLPWSTTATTIAIVAWAASLLFTLRPSDVFEAVRSPYALFAVLLVLLAAAGMFYADVTWAERIKGFGPFYKLLCIPLLIAQFRQSERGLWIAATFLASCGVLVLVSLYLFAWPGLTFRGRDNPGVWVRDYQTQSALFMLCAFGLTAYALRAFRDGRGMPGMLAIVAAIVFFCDVALVLSTGSAPAFLSASAVFIALTVLLALREFGWGGVPIAAVALGLVSALVWFAVPPVKTRAVTAVEEVQAYRHGIKLTYPGLRYEVSNEAARLSAQAPVLGHGTGTIPKLFHDFGLAKTGALIKPPTNPHQQILAVAMQIGAVGAALLIAMWIAHLVLFSAEGLIAWFGLMIVVQNIVAATTSSFLFDYTSGWLYAFGVGVMGGALLRSRKPAAAPATVSGTQVAAGAH